MLGAGDGSCDRQRNTQVKETCISWDKRVHRGNTYSMYTQNAIKEACGSLMMKSSNKVEVI